MCCNKTDIWRHGVFIKIVCSFLLCGTYQDRVSHQSNTYCNISFPCIWLHCPCKKEVLCMTTHSSTCTCKHYLPSESLYRIITALKLKYLFRTHCWSFNLSITVISSSVNLQCNYCLSAEPVNFVLFKQRKWHPQPHWSCKLKTPSGIFTGYLSAGIFSGWQRQLIKGTRDSFFLFQICQCFKIKTHVIVSPLMNSTQAEAGVHWLQMISSRMVCMRNVCNTFCIG